jgi:hypothetical protein
MAREAIRIPVELKGSQFVRSASTVEFARFLLETEIGSYDPDPDFGCRSSHFTPEYEDDLRVTVRNHLIEQFRRYMGINVNVLISDNVESPLANFACQISGTDTLGNRFKLTWEI